MIFTVPEQIRKYLWRHKKRYGIGATLSLLLITGIIYLPRYSNIFPFLNLNKKQELPIVNNQKQVVQIDVQGAETKDEVSLTPFPSPKSVDSPAVCMDTDFSEKFWDVSHYNKDQSDYYLPTDKSSQNFLYPTMIYKKKVAGSLKKFHLIYEANYQNKNTASSATLYAALYDEHKRHVFEINAPEPNRQLIFLHTEIPAETLPTVVPTPIPPIVLPKPMLYNGTQEITVTTKNVYLNAVTFVIVGKYIDTDGNSQTYYGEIQTKLDTIDPSMQDFDLVIGTGKWGKLKIKKFSVCD